MAATLRGGQRESGLRDVVERYRDRQGKRVFADDTTAVGLSTDNDETAYREQVRDLAVCCQDNNLSFNVSKTKELIVDYRKWKAEQAPIHINGVVVEQVESFKLLSVHITKDLSLSTHTVVKSARQCLFPLRRLKRFCMGT